VLCQLRTIVRWHGKRAGTCIHPEFIKLRPCPAGYCQPDKVIRQNKQIRKKEGRELPNMRKKLTNCDLHHSTSIRYKDFYFFGRWAEIANETAGKSGVSDLRRTNRCLISILHVTLTTGADKLPDSSCSHDQKLTESGHRTGPVRLGKSASDDGTDGGGPAVSIQRENDRTAIC
jgi:hypothetical protein